MRPFVGAAPSRATDLVRLGDAPFWTASHSFTVEPYVKVAGGVSGIVMPESFGSLSSELLYPSGTLAVTSGGAVSWSGRMLAMGMGPSVFCPSGCFDINMPANGTVIPGYGSAASQTVAGGVISLGLFQTLYYVLPIALGNTSLSGNFALVGYAGAAAANIVVPPNWIPIVQAVSDTARYVFCGRFVLAAGDSIDLTAYKTVIPGMAESAATKTAAYTMNGATDKNILIDTSSGPVTITLPDALSFAGRRYYFKNIGTATNNLAKLLPAQTSQLVDGSPSRTLKINDECSLLAVGGVWLLMGSYYPGSWQTIYSQKTVKAGDTLTGLGGTFASAGLSPANSMVPGSAYEIIFRGKYSTPAVTPPTTVAKVKLGSTEVVTTPALSNPTGATDLGYSGSILLTCESAGTSGVVRAGGVLVFANTATNAITVQVPDKSTTIDTTVDEAITLGAVFSASATGNSNTLTQLIIRESRPVLASN